MGGITFFVDAIYDVYNKAVPNAEEDQKLPEREVLDEVCQILLNVGCLREEGRFPSFRVEVQAVIHPDHLHHHAHFMIMIFPDAHYIESKIDFCSRPQIHAASSSVREPPAPAVTAVPGS